jgi:hypothetical protein
MVGYSASKDEKKAVQKALQTVDEKVRDWVVKLVCEMVAMMDANLVELLVLNSDN